MAERRPTVLVLVKGLGLGGAERLIVEQVVGALRGEGSMDFVVAHVRRDKTHFVPQLEAAGASVVLLSGAGARRPWPRALRALVREVRPDVVHAHSPLLAAAVRVVARTVRPRPKVAYTEHNRWSAYRLPTRVANAVTMPWDDVTWAVSEEARRSVRPAWLRRRVETLLHGVDGDAIRAAGRRTPDEPVPARGSTTFLHVANRRPEKAHEVLLAAFALAAARDPGLRLWLVGQHLDDAVLQAVLADHPARERIDVLGYRADAPALMARADALVLSSHHEGLPVAVMEAFASGLPVVSTAVGGVPEAVRDGVEGVLVPPNDPAALADALVALAADPARRRALASGARRRAAAFDAASAHGIQRVAYQQLAGR